MGVVADQLGGAITALLLGVPKAQLSADARKFFTEPHHDGYPAGIVNLEAGTPSEPEPPDVTC